VSSSANTPGEANLEDFYDSSPLERDQLYQGEILVNVPILTIPKPAAGWNLLRTRSGRRVDEALEHGNLGGLVNVLNSHQSREQWYTDGRGDFAMALLDKSPVLVLSHTCDIQTKDYIQIAPIYPANSGAEDLERLKAGRKFSAFWLKQYPPEIPVDSYADLELIQAVHETYLRRIRNDQHFRLKTERIRSLQKSVTRYFGRPNSYDAQSDSAPTTGIYLCVWCFYIDAVITKIELTEGSPLTFCTTCGNSQWVIKGH
jgi:hypothetical protein